MFGLAWNVIFVVSCSCMTSYGIGDAVMCLSLNSNFQLDLESGFYTNLPIGEN